MLKLLIRFKIFGDTFNRPLIENETLKRIATYYPTLYYALEKKGVKINSELVNSEKLRDIRENDFCKELGVELGPLVGFSFGSFLYFYFYYYFLAIGQPESFPIQIWSSHEDICSSPELMSILKRTKFVDLKKPERISRYQLYQYAITTSLIPYRKCTTLIMKEMNKKLGLTSTEYYKENVEFTNGDREYSDTILKRLAKGLNRNMCHEGTNINGLFKNLVDNGEKIIVISTRDNMWAGPGQEHRNVSVEDVKQIVQALVSKGYVVIRSNITGPEVEYKNKNFYDLVTYKGISAIEQLYIAANSILIIGADSGTYDLFRISGWVPSFSLDFPLVFVNEIDTGTTISTQNLRTSQRTRNEVKEGGKKNI